jgi:hypothetical protein
VTSPASKTVHITPEHLNRKVHGDTPAFLNIALRVFYGQAGISVCCTIFRIWVSFLFCVVFGLESAEISTAAAEMWKFCDYRRGNVSRLQHQVLLFGGDLLVV